MNEPIPKAFAAFYVADETIGGLIEALKRAEIDALAIPSERWPKDWIPEWVPDPERVTYYVLVKWNDEARFIAHRDLALDEWIRDRKIVLLPRHRWALFRRAD